MTFSCVHPSRVSARSSSSTTLRVTRPSPLPRMYGKRSLTKGTGCVVDQFRNSFHESEESLQCLRKLSHKPEVAAKRAHYDKISTERIRERMVGFQERSHVAPTLLAYYQAIVAPGFCEKIAAASTHRLTKAFGETLISLE